MLGRRKRVKATRIDSLIGRNTELMGDIRFSGGLHVDGTIRGNVLAINLADGANPVIETDNVYEENAENGIAYDTGITSSPPPTVPEL